MAGSLLVERTAWTDFTSQLGNVSRCSTAVSSKRTLIRPDTDRTKRVKDARSEAEKEINEYRDQKEGEFGAFEKKVSLRDSTRFDELLKVPSCLCHPGLRSVGLSWIDDWHFLGTR